MTQLSKEELTFLLNAISEINISAMNPNGIQIIRQAQGCINTLNKMITEASNITNPTEAPAEVAPVDPVTAKPE